MPTTTGQPLTPNAGTPEPGPAAPVAEEPRLALPTAWLMLAALGTPAACAAGWWLVASLAGWSAPTARAGLGGAAVVAAAMVISLVAIGPWKARPLQVWMTAWLASMALRLLLTPTGAFLLYSAALLSPEALAIAVALAYLLSLLVEAVILARHVERQARPARSAATGPGVE